MIGITLIAAITAALIPAIILVGGRRKAEPKKEPARKKDSGDDIETLDDDVAVMEESSDAIDVSETSDFQLGDSSSDLLASGSDDNLTWHQANLLTVVVHRLADLNKHLLERGL